jgi:4-oxalocrotonate tautomerase
MPLIQVKLIADGVTLEQKREITKTLTEVMVRIEGNSMRRVPWVVIDEVRSSDWGIGGRTPTSEANCDLAEGNAE